MDISSVPMCMQSAIVDVGTIYEGTSNILLNTIAKHIRRDYGS